MNYRRLGNTGKQVSVLGFGLMRLPVFNHEQSRIDEEQSWEMVETAIEHGVNYFDTAYPYHGGKSEEFASKIIMSGYRDKIYIADKMPSWQIKVSLDMDKYLQEQLQRLKTEYIDFYLLHALNAKNWKNLKELGVLDWLQKKKQEGRISHIGFSFHDKFEVFEEIITAFDWEFCQIQYNYLDTEFQAGQAGLRLAAERGAGIVVMEPLRGGLLANVPPRDVERVIEEMGYPGSQVSLSLRWIWQQPEVDIILSGMSNLAQVKENVALAGSNDLRLNAKENELVEQLKASYLKRKQIACTGCEYCLPCPQNVAIPNVFEYYNTAHIFDDQAYGRRFYNFIKEENRADKCIGCGECEEKCPQNIAIIEKLKEAHAYLRGEA
jgi:uncharacterized protein